MCKYLRTGKAEQKRTIRIKRVEFYIPYILFLRRQDDCEADEIEQHSVLNLT